MELIVLFQYVLGIVATLPPSSNITLPLRKDPALEDM
jgi:hypothetical protein